ncbi:hypothetical protein EFN63_08065 [Leuconostoc citreum]|uniref:Uncharacterized protein n=1 Tax=Leuconostoc citreum TaxID=33964 RepID=A0A5A5U4B0_LEUCI|nr:hypothetical protein [Leuconostoc citreum]MCT3068309.1 hypothetical protein [Leuconostoc citreum]OSP82551.1 hypothetical protein B9J75_03595 [Leuconostoc citreum]TDG65410.1 hypothetical protein C5L21_000613 [Leuconostoc citreum]UVW15866.1 hypothetical protein NX813_05450 [Leuconostoc citreum]GDZ84795.1 hypothetical protein LCIT_20370 [Leuconostoc citreum]
MGSLAKDKAEKIKGLLKENYPRIIVEKLPQGFGKEEIEKTKISFLKSDGPFDGFGTVYGKCSSKAQRNYQYVFVSVIDDGKVAVVGKTSFWDTRLENGNIDPDSSEKYNLGDLYRPYSRKKSSPTAQAITAHYQGESVSDVNEKITYAVIIPIDNSGFDTEEVKARQQNDADKHTHEQEKIIGDLILDEFDILNSNSHKR